MFLICKMTSVNQQALSDNIATLMESEKYSDLIIKCQGQEWHVHKAIICSASPFLAKECDSQMREGWSGIINHDETFDADTVGRMIPYIYKQTYEVSGEDGLSLSRSEEGGDVGGDAARQSVDINDILTAHVEVYGIGDYYNIKNLKIFAAERFDSISKRGLVVDGLLDVIKAVNARTSHTDRALRDVLRNYAMSHRAELVSNTPFITELADLPDVQDFAADMFREAVRQQLSDKAEFEQQVATLHRTTTEKDQKVRQLETEKREMQDSASEKYKHLESVMAKLIESLDSLPAVCRSWHCDQEFPTEMVFERKGHARYGAGEENRVVRCGKCRCKLVS